MLLRTDDEAVILALRTLVLIKFGMEVLEVEPRLHESQSNGAVETCVKLVEACCAYTSWLGAQTRALRAVEACGAASMDLMRMDIVTFLEYHVVASQDLVFALVASMLNVPVALQILHEGIADLPGDGNYSGEQFGKVLEQIVARLSERGRAEEVDNWSGGGRLC